MARYKPYSNAQGKLVSIHFAKQILPGTLEPSCLAAKNEINQA